MLLDDHLPIPLTQVGLLQVLKPFYMRYAQHLNRVNGQQGHVWQGRYISSVPHGDYFRECPRYGEGNPVRARMVRKAEKYEWSSARGHYGRVRDTLLKAKLL